eukprot:CAMPEP_0197187098 /NCGR_PEP_ID=MMETSP1423-20130617/15235_1 /TAXON_ID=476441 /ORGANISM="Pseudo-nitzschia heimii, Strain UNC1101" /LENGTH=1014 /DNA_ID=CAMNT_0042638587 /DNA_START=252 /DNA_END=3293 /DNA_ORIENTATION=+
MVHLDEWHRILLNTTTETADVDDSSIFNVVGRPILLGALSLLFCMIFFVCAVHYEWTYDLAPRCANRPKAVIKNAILADVPEKYRTNCFIYPVAWIIWSYKLTYKKLIVGIPGTGTRKDGWEGPLLKTNVDAVVLLKFHTLLFKISVLVAFLCMFVIIPVNISAYCDENVFGMRTCLALRNNTNFIKTTVANVPSKFYNNATDQLLENDINSNSIVGILYGMINNNQTAINEFLAYPTLANGTALQNIFSDDYLRNMASVYWVKGQTWRICAILICCLAIYSYTLYLLTQEWIENVALRRAFFLEASHYGQRMIELNKLDFDFVSKKKKNDDYDGVSDRSEVSWVFRDECENLAQYMTHPEIRETPPSIGMYSVLFQLPNSMVTYDTNGATSLERQLVATTEFFDETVPPQPGFSSSVVAVTMIPKAKLVAKAWTKWSACVMKLQSLRHIRDKLAKSGIEGIRQFGQKSKMETRLCEQMGNMLVEKMRPILEKDDHSCSGEGDIEKSFELTPSMSSSNCKGAREESIEFTLSLTGINGRTNGLGDGANVGAYVTSVPSTRTETFKYENFDVRRYAKSLGFDDEADRMTDFVAGMGIEEFSVFVRKTALMASGLAVNKTMLKMYSDEALIEEERDIIEELRDLEEDLAVARADVVKLDDSEILVGSKSSKRPGINAAASLDEINGVRHSMMFDSVDDKNEWRVSEREYEQTLQILESNHESKPEGRFRPLKNLMMRIFRGPSYMDMDPKYYGYEKDNPGAAFATDVKHPSYAVVTFTSRHAAITARQCLADGRPTNNWQSVDDIPIYPLADAPPLIWFPMGIMRPVTPTISYYSKRIRRWIAYSFVVLFTALYIVPINFINRYLWNTAAFKGILGDSTESYKYFLSIRPTLSGLTQSLLFCICPFIFSCVANKDGTASSMAKAESRAMIYFWYFFIVARFMGPLMYQMFQEFLYGDFSTVEQLLFNASIELTRQAPTLTGPFALTYIIFIATISFPTMYWLQLNNFLTSVVHLKW